MSRFCKRDRSALWLGAFIALPIAASAPVLGGPTPPGDVSFAVEILPLIRENCLRCHSGENPKAGFSLESRDSMLAHDSAVVPGDSEASLLIHLVRGDDLITMPPEGDVLSDAQIDLLARWIDQGAVWDIDEAQLNRPRPHLTPRSPSVPIAHDGIDHPIDLLIHGYWAELDLEGTREIDDPAFLRRASLDIVGLLPTPEQLDRFLADEHANKRSRAVAALLADDVGYADHWLSFWNDLLRNDYAGTGYIDGGRTQITKWLYESLQQNKPYDQFVAELVAPTPESAGFSNGIKWRGDVNASQRRELQFAQNISQVFLGLNMKCASCHDSFINDWKLRDAYGLAAIIADEPLELYRCDQPTGELAQASFVFPELGDIDPNAPRAERLSQFAALLTSPDNGRLATTIVNRLWARLMGRGLVEPVDEMANPAWSEDLIDFLAADLVEHGYDLKRTIALITTSQAYQRVATAVEDDEFIFRGPSPQRMTAEQFVDAVWMLTDSAPTEPDVNIGDEPRMVRASLKRADQLMRSLGRPPREQVVTGRPAELTTLQALELSNGAAMSRLLGQGAKSLLARCDGVESIVESVYRSALSRSPTTHERSLAIEFLEDQPDQTDAVADFLWSIIMLPEFQLVRQELVPE